MSVSIFTPEGLLDAQRHVSREVHFAIQQTRKCWPRNVKLRRRRNRETSGNDNLPPDESPGWCGFFIGIAVSPSLLVVVFQVHVTDLALCGAKLQTPIPCDAEVPRPFTVAGQRMRVPGCEGIQYVRIFHVVGECEDHAEFIDAVGLDTFRTVFHVELVQALIREVPYFTPTGL